MLEPSVIKVGLLWHSFYSGNLGVAALTHSNMSIISEAARQAGYQVEFMLFGPKGDKSFSQPSEFGPITYIEASSLMGIWKYRKLMADCDLVFDIGAGDSFADTYGLKRFAKISGLKFLVPEPELRLILSPQTLGPFKNPIYRWIANTAMRRARLIYARDNLSFDRVKKSLGARSAERLRLSTDVAFSLRYEKFTPEYWSSLSDESINIGFNVSGLLFYGGYSGHNQFGLSVDYAQLVRDALRAYTDQSGYKVWLLPHVYRIDGDSTESDRVVAELLASEFPALQIAPMFRSAAEAKTFISKLDLVVAARMHVAIAAVSSGVACLPMSYSVKFEGLFDSLGKLDCLNLRTVNYVNALDCLCNAPHTIPDLREKACATRDAAGPLIMDYKKEVLNLINSLSDATV